MKLNKTMKKILSFMLSLAMIFSTLSLNIVKADDEWVSTNNGWINFTEEGYSREDNTELRYAVEGISAIYAGVWSDAQTANIDVKRNAEEPYSLPINVNNSTNNEQWLIQVAFNVKNLDTSKVYQVNLKLDDTVLFTTTVSSAEKYENTVGVGNNGAFTVGEHTLKVETKELVKGDTQTEVQKIEITPNESQIAATKKIWANWTNPEGAAKTYAYLEEVKEDNGVATDGKGWVFNKSALQPMTGVDNVSRTQGDTDTIYVEAGKTYKFIVVSYDAFEDKIGEGSVDIAIPGKTQEEIDEENRVATLKAKLASDDNLAKNKTAFALSKLTDVTAITDGNVGSKWQAEKDVENSTFGVNLGEVKNISSVVVSWEASNATAYDIYVAGEDEVYSTIPVASVSGLDANKDTILETPFDTISAQYVKVVVTGWSTNAENYGIAVYELGVFDGTEEVTTVAETTSASDNPETTSTSDNPETTSKQDGTKLAAPEGLQHAPAADGSLPYYFAWAAETGAVSYNVYVNGTKFTNVVGASCNLADYDFSKPGEYIIGVTAVSEDNIESDMATVTFTVKGEGSTTAATEDKTTAATEDKTTAATEDKTTAATEDKTTAATEDKTTAATEDKTTAATEDKTTAATEDKTTAATEDKTTAATEDKTTAATEDKTTAATEKVTTKATATQADKPGKTAITKVTKKKSAAKVKITFKKVTGAKKYQVQISTSKKFKKILVNKVVKKVKVTIKSRKLKNKKKLYVRVKAVGADKWSKVKKIKIK